MKIGTVKAIFYLKMLVQLSPYLLHFPSDLCKIHYWRWCLLCGQNYPYRKFCVRRCIVVTQALFVWPKMKRLTRWPCHRGRCSKKKGQVFWTIILNDLREKNNVCFKFRYVVSGLELCCFLLGILLYLQIGRFLEFSLTKISDKLCI